MSYSVANIILGQVLNMGHSWVMSVEGMEYQQHILAVQDSVLKTTLHQ